MALALCYAYAVVVKSVPDGESMADEAILRITGLTKEYDALRAVDHISFSVNPGEIVGLLGPNGAGKTTTINMILGILEPTGGSIEILDRNVKECGSETRKSVNFAAVYAHVPANLTVWQNLYVFGLLYEVRQLKREAEHPFQGVRSRTFCPHEGRPPFFRRTEPSQPCQGRDETAPAAPSR